MTLQFALTVALRAVAIVGAGSTARLAYEHHAVRAAQVAVTTVSARVWHRTRRAFISPGTRVAGRDTPKPAREAATA